MKKTRNIAPKEPMLWAWRVVHPDFTSRDDFKWPFPGNWCEAPGPFLAHEDPCPGAPGDGVCLAKTWSGAASGRITARAVLVCGYFQSDVLGGNSEKLRVKRAYVAELWSAEKLIKAFGNGADLSGADLRSAYLGGADLSSANLSGANLSGAKHDSTTTWPKGFKP